MTVNLLTRITYWLALLLIANRRKPDQIIYRNDGEYLRRWWVFGATTNDHGVLVARRFFGRGVYLHNFVQSDEDRAKHDHPWAWSSWLLRGDYWEWVDQRAIPEGSVMAVRLRQEGEFRSAPAAYQHRIELVNDINGDPMPVWSLFFMGPWERDWGFWCKQGWVFWRDFDRHGGC